MNWADYIVIAEAVKNNTKANDAEKRSAISRAYYAARNLARDALEARGISCAFPGTTRPTHASIIDALTKVMPQLGGDLDNAKEYRESADYLGVVLGALETDKRLAVTIKLAREIETWATNVHASVNAASASVGQKRTIVKPRT